MGRVRKKYSREFKLEALRALKAGNHTASELALRLNVRESDLRDWSKEYEKYKEESFPGQGRRGGQAGKIMPIVERTWEFSEVSTVLHHVGTGHSRGLNVVRISCY